MLNYPDKFDKIIKLKNDLSFRKISICILTCSDCVSFFNVIETNHKDANCFISQYLWFEVGSRGPSENLAL